ncbi:MAG: nitrous oxide-stimulated promoter family protein [Oligoflexia bacterium]|nr:nitrous oxide-stimulated promoter family protein [Oligoflexia bacterium]
MAMQETSPRYKRELATLTAMALIHCRAKHGDGRALPCEECRKFLDYAAERLGKCAFGETKPTCVKCPIHCYASVEKERARTIMREAGPKMLLRHPVLTLLHFLDGWLSGGRLKRWYRAREAKRTQAVRPSK